MTGGNRMARLLVAGATQPPWRDGWATRAACYATHQIVATRLLHPLRGERKVTGKRGGGRLGLVDLKDDPRIMPPPGPNCRAPPPPRVIRCPGPRRTPL